MMAPSRRFESDDKRLIREIVVARSDDGLRQAKVEYLDHALRCDLDVRGLQVAVDDPFFVSFFQRATDLASDVQCVLYRQSAWRRALREDLLKGSSIHELQVSDSGARLPLRCRKWRRCWDDSGPRACVPRARNGRDAAHRS